MNKWPKQSECKKLFGNPTAADFEDRNIVSVKPPYAMFMGDLLIKNIRVNKICADSLLRVLTHIWDLNERNYDKIKAQQLHIFSGTWNIRPMRGGSALSTHAYGLAIDIAAPYNALGKKPGYNKFSFTEDHPLVKAFEAEGWVWGGRWEKRPDGMHFQAARVG